MRTHFYDIQAWAAQARERGVSPAIVERVVRLNPDPEPGRALRGIHYKDDRAWALMYGHMRKGAFIRRYGREAFDAVDPQDIRKRGRRVLVSIRAITR